MAAFAVYLFVPLYHAPAVAQVVPDGSLTLPCPLNGPHFVVPAGCGRTVGSNLFQSFSHFNINAGESVTFTGDASVVNLLTRVTGNEASNINGPLKTDGIPGVNFFLINRNGVIFGPNASLDVGGSFVVTTADEVKLADGGRFHAADPAQSVLTTTSPSAFGFVDQNPGGVQVAGDGFNHLSVAGGKTLSLIAGDIQVDRGTLEASAGQVLLVSVAGSGEVVGDITGRQSAVLTDSFDNLGAIEILDKSTVSTDGDPGGRVTVFADQLWLEGSDLSARTEGGLDGQGVELGLRGTLNMTDSGKILTRAEGAGMAGSIFIDARSILVQGGSSISADSLSSGAGGQIVLRTGDLIVSDGAEIRARAGASGAGGSIVIEADWIAVGGQDDAVTGIFADSGRGTSGQGGSIEIKTVLLQIEEVAAVSTTTNGSGAGGNIDVWAERVLIDGRGLMPFTGIGANTQALVDGGPGGTIHIETHLLDILDGGGVAAKSFGDGDAGSIELSLGRLLIDGRGGGGVTGLTVETERDPVADGGDITVRASSQIDLITAEITTSASGDGGEISLLAPEQIRVVDGQITTNAGSSGGNIVIAGSAIQQVPTLTTEPVKVFLLDPSSISANAGRRTAGNITIDALNFIASPLTFESAAVLQFSDGSVISATSQQGISGNILITAPELDIASSLLLLSESLVDPSSQLAEQCAIRFQEGRSGFAIDGRGGLPIEPGSWLPSLELGIRSETKRRVQSGP